LLNKHISHLLDSRVALLNATFIVSEQVGERLLPVCCIILLPEHIRASQDLKVSLVNGAHDRRDEWIFLLYEVLCLDCLEELRASLLCNEKRFCGTTTFERNFSSVFEIAKKQVLLNKALLAFIPVGVARYLLEDDLARHM